MSYTASRRGDNWPEKGEGGEPERGWKRVALEHRGRKDGVLQLGRMTGCEMGESQWEMMAERRGKRAERKGKRTER